METERAYLVKIGECWIDLREICYIMPPNPESESPMAKCQLRSGVMVEMPPSHYQQLMDKLQSFGMLGS